MPLAVPLAPLPMELLHTKQTKGTKIIVMHHAAMQAVR